MTAERYATQVCGWSPAEGEVAELDTGFANHNWKVTVGSDAVLMKIGPVASASKWAAAQVGADRARALGLPIPRLRSVQPVGDHLVRVLDWIDGQPASALAGEAQRLAQVTLGADLGKAVAELQTDSLDRYGSRLDASGPFFASWADYVDERLRQIDHRAGRADAPAPTLRRQASASVQLLARRIEPYCRPVVCHRDLHAENLVVDTDGSLVGIIDWDMAEAWDSAGEWFKLERFLFPLLPGARASFEAACPRGEEHTERQRLVAIIESLNLVANAGTFDPDFVQFGLDELERLV